MERHKVLWRHFPIIYFPSPSWSLVATPPAATADPGKHRGSGQEHQNRSPLLYTSHCSQQLLVPNRTESRLSSLLSYCDRYVSGLISLFGLDKGSLLPISISWTTEELHKHKEEILIKFGLVKSIPDNPHNTKTNSILLVVIQNKGHSHLSFVY